MPTEAAVATTDAHVSDLATILGNDQAANVDQDKGFTELASSARFLPRLQLFGANSTLVKEGAIPMAHFGLVKGKGKDKLVDMGKNVPMFVLAFRAKSLLIDSKTDTVKSYFDRTSKEFLAIRDLVPVKDSGAMVGPEFLIFIPGTGFALFFMATKTALNEAENVKGMIGKPATLCSKLIKTKKYTWHGPEILPSSVPLEQPDSVALQAVLIEFRNPKDTVDEVDNNGATTPTENR